MKKKTQELKVETIGKPSAAARPDAEKKVFFETLLNHIKEVKAEGNKNNA